MTVNQSKRPSVVAVGLGPAGPEHTTPAAVAALSGAPVVFLRTSRHPGATRWLGLANVVVLDHCYEAGATFERGLRLDSRGGVCRRLASMAGSPTRFLGRLLSRSAPWSFSAASSRSG